MLLGGCASGFLWLLQVLSTCVSEPLQWGGLTLAMNQMKLWRNSSFELCFTLLGQKQGGRWGVLGVLKAEH